MYTPGGAYQSSPNRLQQHRAFIGRIVDRIVDRLFAEEDANAIAHGWEIRRRQGGRGRVYRDPRWDSIQSCELCAGAGCPSCGGSGVIRKDIRTEARS